MQVLSPLVELHLHRNKPTLWIVISRIAHYVMSAPRIPCQLRPLVQTLSFRPVYFLCKANKNHTKRKVLALWSVGHVLLQRSPSCLWLVPVSPAVWEKSPPLPYTCHRGSCLYKEPVSRRRVLGKMVEWSRFPQVNK